MTNTEFLNQNYSADWDDILLDVEEDKPIHLYTFLRVNLLDEDVNHISIEDAQRVINLEPGQSTFINLTEIKRIV